ncbi:DMT family transporter [Acetobacterium malicum]|uniref:DMT family transporter n=1 Tax=Acetobacterium malicum TaxID=52692 RepID=UPI0035947523
MSIGVVAAIGAALLAGTIPILTKVLMLDGIGATTILFYRYAFIFILSGFTFIVKRKNIKVTKKQLFELGIFSIFGYTGATLLLIQSFNFMPVGLASMLYFSYPFFVFIIMSMVFKETPSRLKIYSLLIVVVGIAFLINFDVSLINSGGLLALGSGLAYGIYLVGLQKSSLKEIDNAVTIFYLGGISAVILGIQGTIYTDNSLLLCLTVKRTMLTMTLAVITIVVLKMIAFAIKKSGSTETSLIIAFESVVTLILSILFFGEPWNGNTVAGAVLMLVAVILVSRTAETNRSLG